MKKLVILITMFFVFGCQGLQIQEDEVVPVMAGIIAKEIGCEVALSSDPDIDMALRNAYTLARSGELSNEAVDRINDLLLKEISDRPTLIDNVFDLMRLIGVKFDARSRAAKNEVVEIPEELYNEIEKGYLRGFELCIK
ncbi:MAG: hypothetical protein ACXADW_20340 [Candidatus Hodarchaeales archaeon]|jgi:hypothetical protein